MTERPLFKIKGNFSDFYPSNLRIFRKNTQSFRGLVKLPSDIRELFIVSYNIIRLLDEIEDNMAIDFNEKDRDGKKESGLNEKDRDRKKELMELVEGSLKDYSGEKSKKLEEELKGIKSSKVEFQGLLNNVDKVFSAYYSFPNNVKNIIKNRVGEMISGLKSRNVRNIDTIENYHEYCHYSTGVVGYLISELLNAGGYFDKNKLNLVISDESTKRPGVNSSHDFGVALQILNDIRDLHEDYFQDKFKWPREIIESRGLNYEGLVHIKLDNDELRRMKAEWILEDMIEDANRYFTPGINFVETIPREDKSIVRCFGGVYCLAAATKRIVSNKDFLYDETKRNISREEFKRIGEVVKRLTDNETSLSGLIEHLLEKPAKEFRE